MTVWAAVDRVVDGTTSPAGLWAHGLDLWAAQRWYSTDRPVPPEFLAHERAAAMALLSLPSFLAWIRGTVDGPIVLLKGPEVAARYPDPVLRPFGDLDLLVPSADDAQRRLLDAGCVEVEGVTLGPGSQHRTALRCPGSLLLVEIHERPPWPSWTQARTDELFASAIPSVLGIDGILTVPPAQHAVLLAAHSWHHEPFRRLIDLVDIAAMTEGLDPVELRVLAERWALGRVWDATIRTIDAFRDGEPPRSWSDRLMGQHLWSVRERTMIEWRLARWTTGFWAPTPSVAVRSIVGTILQNALPVAGESWSSKLVRTIRVLGRSLRPASERL
jgi:hypothetical protein